MPVFPGRQEVFKKEGLFFPRGCFFISYRDPKATKESMVRIMGFEPIRLMATDFESASSTDSNISAY